MVAQKNNAAKTIKSGKAFSSNKGLAKGLKRLRAHLDAPKAAKGQKAAPAPKASQNANQKPQNPYREGGSYHACFEAIRTMGFQKFHAFDALLGTYKKIVGPTSWKEFAAKKSRNENGLEAEGRVFQNFTVICRKDRYGLPKESGLECRKEAKSFGIFKLGK